MNGSGFPSTSPTTACRRSVTRAGARWSSNALRPRPYSSRRHVFSRLASDSAASNTLSGMEMATVSPLVSPRRGVAIRRKGCAAQAARRLANYVWSIWNS